MKPMKPCINVIMPMLGGGTRMEGMQNTCKPLMTLPDGMHFFRKALQSLVNYDIHLLVLVVLKDYEKEFEDLEMMIKRETQCDMLRIVPHVPTPTPVHSVLTGIKQYPRLVESHFPLLILDCDIYGVLPAIPQEEEKDLVARLFWFRDDNPNKSFISVFASDESKVAYVKEKQAISDRAIFGAYMFYDKSYWDFLLHCFSKESTLSTMKHKYISDIVDYYLKSGRGVVRCCQVEGRVTNFGTREEYEQEYGQ